MDKSIPDRQEPESSVQHRPRYRVNYALRNQMSPFFQGSETNVPIYFLSVLNTERVLVNGEW